jgi:hypothetical protein
MQCATCNTQLRDDAASCDACGSILEAGSQEATSTPIAPPPQNEAQTIPGLLFVFYLSSHGAYFSLRVGCLILPNRSDMHWALSFCRS